MRISWQRIIADVPLPADRDRAPFTSADAFIAFLGLDVRVQDSGTSKGKRKLTKQGEGECRRLLHNAAIAACRKPDFAPGYQRYLNRGFSRIQALVALARKLARIAFALLEQQATFNPEIYAARCATTQNLLRHRQHLAVSATTFVIPAGASAASEEPGSSKKSRSRASTERLS